MYETFGKFPEFEKLLSLFRSHCAGLGLEPTRFVVVGSGVLAVHGLREVHDLDLVAMPDAWAKLSQFSLGEANYMGGSSKRIHVLHNIECFNTVDVPNMQSDVAEWAQPYTWRKPRDVRWRMGSNELHARAELIGGLRYQPLEDFHAMKLGMDRPKDKADVVLAAKRLEEIKWDLEAWHKDKREPPL